MKKIAVMGVHSSGKTTLAYLLSAYFKMKDLNVKLIHESVRENCPFPINDKATQQTCLWNFHTQFLNELEAESQGYQLAICDRSVIDTFVYYHAVNPATSITKSALNQAADWLITYDAIVCLEPHSQVKIFNDGIRSMDKSYQQLINEEFKKIIAHYGTLIKERIFFGTSDDVFSNDKRVELIKKIEQRVFFETRLKT